MTTVDEHDWHWNGIGILYCSNCDTRVATVGHEDWFPGFGEPPEFFRCHPKRKLAVIELDERGLAVRREWPSPPSVNPSAAPSV